MRWRLDSYRATIRRLARIEVPGTRVTGPAEDLFVWPRAREYDRTRPSGFEDEDPELVPSDLDGHIDLRTFPNNDWLGRILVVGGPGYGKSALLTAMAGRLADGPLVPALVPLARLASSDGSVLEFLTDGLNSELDVEVGWRALAEQGLLVALFDGLDEVPTERRARLMGWIADFSARYPHAPWVLTVRDPAVVTGVPEATVVELLPLDAGDMERFATAMEGILGDIGALRFVRRLERYPDLNRLARVPLFLAMLLATYEFDKAGPLTRSELIESYLKTLFRPGEHKRHVEDRVRRPALLRQVSETLAFELLERQQIGATEEEVLEVVGRASVSESEREAVVEQLKANGILKQRGAVALQFPYPIVQEYLAACHLVGRRAESIESRIEDAVRRPWAQVIQFALEMHAAPGRIIQKIVDRADDAFCTGLRLVGRCIANGASVGDGLRAAVASRLVEYWVRAPWRSRTRVGQLLADGFCDPPTDGLLRALHHRWLIEDGAGEIVSKLNDRDLTLGVLESLIDSDRSGLGVYHSLKPALGVAGDAAFCVVARRLDPDRLGTEALEAISNLLGSFPQGSVSRGLALDTARNPVLPRLARMRAYSLAGPPLETEGESFVRMALRHGDGGQRYEAARLIGFHADPERFMGELIRDAEIALVHRLDLAAGVAGILPDRRGFSEACRADSSVDVEIKLALRLVDARFGDGAVFEGLVEDVGDMPLQHAATTVALFGHFKERELAERARTLVGRRHLSGGEVVRMAHAAVTGMRYVFEMDSGFGGVAVHAPPHPGISAWKALLEDWSTNDDLSQSDRLAVLTAASELGSDWAKAELERIVQTINDFDEPAWVDAEGSGGTVSDALRQIQRQCPELSTTLVEKTLASTNYNVVMVGVIALQARGDAAALGRLLALHAATSEWHLKAAISDSIELVAARQGVVIVQDRGRYGVATRPETSVAGK